MFVIRERLYAHPVVISGGEESDTNANVAMS